MTRRHLEIFVAVAEYGKMSEAARRMYITQSSVSQAIAEIEREYNVRLFERLSKGLFLTEVGENFLSYAKRSLVLQTEMELFLQASSRTMKLRIGATITVGTCVISEIIKRLKRKHPSIRTEVVVANTRILEDKLLRSELDIALVEGRIEKPDIITEKAMDDQMVVICSRDHEFYGKKEIRIRDLVNQPVILREQGSGTRAQLEAEALARHIPLDIVWDCYNTEAIINGVIDGHGISVISRRLVEKQVREGTLWMCELADADFSRSFDLAHHRDKYVSEALQYFVDECLEFGVEEHAGLSDS